MRLSLSLFNFHLGKIPFSARILSMRLANSGCISAYTLLEKIKIEKDKLKQDENKKTN
jgi:hypothetical protein